ncbi:hypothetical protein J1614_002447 [Plenodomus biglobosus]|nr:hypothetical protein J1614_002447 [Plenodomus biglobosus]
MTKEEFKADYAPRQIAGQLVDQRTCALSHTLLFTDTDMGLAWDLPSPPYVGAINTPASTSRLPTRTLGGATLRLSHVRPTVKMPAPASRVQQALFTTCTWLYMHLCTCKLESVQCGMGPPFTAIQPFQSHLSDRIQAHLLYIQASARRAFVRPMMKPAAPKAKR